MFDNLTLYINETFRTLPFTSLFYSSLSAILFRNVFALGLSISIIITNLMNKYLKLICKDMYKKYQVEKTSAQPQLKGDWAGDVWGKVETVDIKHYMGSEPEHKPKTQAKVLYDEEFVYVIFRVEDKYVRAVSEGYQSMVCFDSCAEFFFTPGPNVSSGYFNIEINCGGTMLFNFQTIPWVDVVPISDSDCDKVRIFHSEPRIVEPEKQEPTTWFIEYRVPIDVLENYFPEVARPAPGVLWRANFYKCADKTSHPHALTWSVVDWPEPDFHQPGFFGTLEFK